MKRKSIFRGEIDPSFQAFADKLIAETRLAAMPLSAEPEPDYSAPNEAIHVEEVVNQIQSNDAVDSPGVSDFQSAERSAPAVSKEGASLHVIADAPVPIVTTVNQDTAPVDTDERVAPLFLVELITSSSELGSAEELKPSSGDGRTAPSPPVRDEPRTIGSVAKSPLRASAVRLSAPKPKIEQSLAQLTEFLDSLPSSLPANNRVSASDGTLRVPAELMELLRVLPKYMAGLLAFEVGDKRPGRFRVDDLACYLLREFLKENISSFQAMVRSTYRSA